MDVASSQPVSTVSPAVETTLGTDPGPAPYATPGAVPVASDAGTATAPTAKAAAAGNLSSDSAKSDDSAGPLQSFAGAVQTVFAGQNIEVNFRVAHDPNEIVIVYRNAQTGQIINQVPPEAIVRLAEFFQREASGALVDQGV